MSVKIPKGFVRAPGGHVLRGNHTDIICGGVGQRYKKLSVWNWVNMLDGKKCDDRGRVCKFVCAIPEPAKPEPYEPAKIGSDNRVSAEAVKCPACGWPMVKHLLEYSCRNAACEMRCRTFPLDILKRMTIAPEPLTCPACGGYVAAGAHDGGMKVVCFNDCCGIQGPFRKTQREAEAAFRRLSFRKEG